MKLSIYTRNHEDFSKNVKDWKKNPSHMFANVLQHFPKYLTQRLKSNPWYSVTNSTKDIIALTMMIFDAAYARDDTTQGTMAIVANEVPL